jgi:predicted enzyme related to lactoylglutathione lyase
MRCLPNSAARRWAPHWSGQANGKAVLSIHVATDDEVDAAVQQAASAGGVVVKPAAPTPLGGSHAFFADPTGTSGRSSTTRSTG